MQATSWANLIGPVMHLGGARPSNVKSTTFFIAPRFDWPFRTHFVFFVKFAHKRPYDTSWT